MKKAIGFLALLLVLCSSAALAAQTPTGQPAGTPSSVVLNWTASVTAGVGYNVYRATATGLEAGTPALNGGTPITATTFTDVTVTSGTTYFYVVSSTLAGVQSKFSNEISVVPTLPAPPVLSGATVAVMQDGNQTRTITASYTDTSGLPTAYQLWGGSTLLQKGQPAISSTGQYSVTWTGRNGKSPSPVLTVEDAAGNVIRAVPN
jgi:hypothetical protein